MILSEGGMASAGRSFAHMRDEDGKIRPTDGYRELPFGAAIRAMRYCGKLVEYEGSEKDRRVTALFRYWMQERLRLIDPDPENQEAVKAACTEALLSEAGDAGKYARLYLELSALGYEVVADEEREKGIISERKRDGQRGEGKGQRQAEEAD